MDAGYFIVNGERIVAAYSEGKYRFSDRLGLKVGDYVERFDERLCKITSIQPSKWTGCIEVEFHNC